MRENERDYDFMKALLKRCAVSFTQSLIASCIVLLVFDEFGIFRVFLIGVFAAVAAFVSGAVFGVPEADSAGTLYIDTSDAETDRYLMDFNSIDDLKKKKKVQIKIRTDRKLNTETKYVGE